MVGMLAQSLTVRHLCKHHCRFVGEVLVRYGSQVEEVEEVAQQFNR